MRVRLICLARGAASARALGIAKAYRDDLTIEAEFYEKQCARLYYRPWDKVPHDEQAKYLGAGLCRS